MSVDPIANMLSSVKNAAAVGKEYIEIPHSKVLENIARVLQESGFLTEVKRFKEAGVSYKKLRLSIAYDDRQRPLFSKLQRVSRLGQRIYKGTDDLRRERFGMTVVSTSEGIMSNKEAISRNLGGEVLLEIV